MKRGTWVIGMVFVVSIGGLWAGGNAEAAVSPETTPDGFKQIELESTEIRWKIDGENVRFELSAPTEGWVAVGFEPSQYMKDANIIISYVRDGEVFVSDQFGSSSFGHRADEELGGTSDVSDPTGSESDGRTNVEFTLPLDSGDGYDQPLREGETITLILAYARDGADDFATKHAVRGSIRVPF